jgi:hypothetical protein
LHEKGLELFPASSRIQERRGTMRPWQKRIDFVSFPIECQRMGTRFRLYDFLPTHRGNTDNVDDARIPDGHIKVARSLIEKNYVWGTAERHVANYAT